MAYSAPRQKRTYLPLAKRLRPRVGPLDRRYTPRYNRLREGERPTMDSISTDPNQTRAFNGYNKQTGKKTCMTGFRIYKAQHETLLGSYSGNASALVRILLEEYFNGTLPDVEAKFEQLLTK